MADDLTVEIVAIRLRVLRDKIEARQEKLLGEIVDHELSVTNDYRRGAINAYGNTLVWLRQLVRTDELFSNFGGS